MPNVVYVPGALYNLDEDETQWVILYSSQGPQRRIVECACINLGMIVQAEQDQLHGHASDQS